MKIVQINAVYRHSSTGRTTMEMHNALKHNGIDSYVFCANASMPKEEGVYVIGTKLDHKIHALCSRIFGLQGYFSYFATRMLMSKLSKIRPDVVILRNLHANYINVPMLLSYLIEHDIATINVLHDCWSFTGHCCYYTEDRCDKWRSGCNHCSILYKYNKSLFFDNTSKLFAMKQNAFGQLKRLAVVGVSNWITNEAKQSPIFSNARIIQPIYNWIDMSVFYPRENLLLKRKLGLINGEFVVLGVAQKWSGYKGVYHFISVAKQMPDVKFVMVGEMLSGIELPNNIISIPPIKSVDVLAQYYSFADVFLNFSIQETFGKVSVEALACGTPIIVNNATANPELCGGGCGFVIDDNNEADIIRAIRQIQQNGKVSYKTKCRCFAESNFDMEKCISQYMELFDLLLN